MPLIKTPIPFLGGPLNGQHHDWKKTGKPPLNILVAIERKPEFDPFNPVYDRPGRVHYYLQRIASGDKLIVGWAYMTSRVVTEGGAI